MKVLLDENLDEGFSVCITDHSVSHVVSLGWQGIQNGQLLAKAEENDFDVFVTADKNMPYQQSIRGRRLFLIVLNIHPNVLENQVSCIPQIEECISRGGPGQVHIVEGPHSKRRRL